MLGDAVLDYIANTYLYYYLPTASPGDLTLWRQRFSRRSTQATIAMHFGLHKVLCYESPTLFRVCARVCYSGLRVGWVMVLHWLHMCILLVDGYTNCAHVFISSADTLKACNTMGLGVVCLHAQDISAFASALRHQLAAMHQNEDLDAVLSNMNEANDLAPKVLHLYTVLVKCLL